jgi:hypothetical protein
LNTYLPGRIRSALELELIKQAIDFSAIEDQRGALVKGRQSRAPVRVERATLDADVGNGIGISKTSVHRNLWCKEFGRILHRQRQTKRAGPLSSCIKHRAKRDPGQR